MATLTLPNPLTPLAWLPPDIARQVRIAEYVVFCTVGAWLWDGLMALPEEYLMFKKHKPTLPDVFYILCRLTSGAFLVLSLVFIAGPVPDCDKLQRAINWCGAFAMPFNSILFYFRVRAVFHDSKILGVAFGLLWLSTLSCFSNLSSDESIEIGTTKVCLVKEVKTSMTVGMVVIALHDTIVYLSISTRLAIISNLTHNESSPWMSFIRGKGLGRVTKTLLQSGQMYYLTTVSMNIVAMAAILSPSFPQVYKAMLLIPNVAVQNAMACRVFRRLKLGLILKNPSISTTSCYPYPSILTNGAPGPLAARDRDSGMVVTLPLQLVAIGGFKDGHSFELERMGGASLVTMPPPECHMSCACVINNV